MISKIVVPSMGATGDDVVVAEWLVKEGDCIKEGQQIFVAETDKATTEVEAFRARPITDEHPYLWIDATYHKVRQDGRVQSMATVVAIGVTTEGERQIVGVDAGPSEDWRV